MKITSNTKIFLEMFTSLIDEQNNCQLRQAKEFNSFYMISPNTGIHQLNEAEFNERIKAHWSGFLKNQNG